MSRARIADMQTTKAAPTKQIDRLLSRHQYDEAVVAAVHGAVEQPGPSSTETVRRVLRQASMYHQQLGKFREAEQYIRKGEQIGGDDPSWFETLAELRARNGDYRKAFEHLAKAPDSQRRNFVEGLAADRAMGALPEEGRLCVPAEWHVALDVTRRAFIAFERGKDDESKELLGQIGLSSPFLEWKLLLRGLTAWNAGDDGRAVDNWSRLNPDRAPYRAAMVLRAGFDRAFHAGLSDREKLTVRNVRSRMNGKTHGELRALADAFGARSSFQDGITCLGNLKAHLIRTSPRHFDRLKQAIYWEMWLHAEPRDHRRFQNELGSPADDPQFDLAAGIICNSVGEFEQAAVRLDRYLTWLKSSDRWTGEMREYAVALVRSKIGENYLDWLKLPKSAPGVSDDKAEDDEVDDFEEALVKGPFGGQGKGSSIRISKATEPPKEVVAERVAKAVAMFDQAIASLPDLKVTYLQLTRLLKYPGMPAAEKQKIIVRMVEQFPTDVDLLAMAANYYRSEGDLASEILHRRKALSANPLDRNLRERLVRAHVMRLKADVERISAEELSNILAEVKSLGNRASMILVRSISQARAYSESTVSPAELLVTVMASEFPLLEMFWTHWFAIEQGNAAKSVKPLRTQFDSTLSATQLLPPEQLSVVMTEMAEWAKVKPIPYTGFKKHVTAWKNLVTQSIKNIDRDRVVDIGWDLWQSKNWATLRLLVRYLTASDFDRNLDLRFFQLEASRHSGLLRSNPLYRYLNLQDKLVPMPSSEHTRLRDLLPDLIEELNNFRFPDFLRRMFEGNLD